MRTLFFALLLWLHGCTGSNAAVQLCDAEAAANTMRAGVAACHLAGYEWAECPQREEILAAETANMVRCSE